MGFIPFSIAPPVIAHRGASAIAPENTFAAFKKAKEWGLRWIELDVMQAATGEIIVMHDEELSRTTNGRGLVIDASYSDLKKLDAGSWFGSSFVGEAIPTLDETLALLSAENMAVNIEIKAFPGYEAETVHGVLDVVKRYALPFFISSFSYDVLERVSQEIGTFPLGFLMDTWQNDWEQKCDAIRAVAVDVNHAILDPLKIEAIKRTNRLLLAYTINDPNRAKKLFSYGVDAVFSDCPKEMLLGFKIST